MYKIISKAITLILMALIASALHAQQATTSSATTAAKEDRIALHQALLDLTNPFTVMCIAAHPDDEDGTTLTVLRRKYGVHTVSLFSTYGEGGQNAVGPELYEELGVIRARETMEAAKIQGSEPHFLGLKDFGYSKSADEAFRIWGHDEALRRMVLQIRKLRPDVIITNHSVANNDHGHHQATARLVVEAFDDAADPKRFSEQLKEGVKPWQVKRLFVRAGGRSAAGAIADDTVVVTIDPNERDATRDMTYAEQALTALQKHATQGPWPRTIADMARFRNATDGKLPLIRYRLVRFAKDSASTTTPPAMGLNSHDFLDGLRLPEEVAAKLSPPMIDEHPLTDFVEQPDRVFTALIEARTKRLATAESDDAQRFRLMSQRLDHALALLSGVTLTLNPSDTELVPDRPSSFAINLANNGNHAARVHRLTFAAWGEERPVEVADELPAGTETTTKASRITPRNATISVPTAEHLYDGHLFGERAASSAMIEVEGARFYLNAETQLEVTPAVELKSIAPSPYVWAPGIRNRPLSFQLQLSNHLSEPFTGALTISSADHRFNSTLDITLGAGETRSLLLQSRDAPTEVAGSRRPTGVDLDLVLLSVLDATGKTVISQRPVPVRYADARLTRRLQVGFIPSFDQTLERSLDALGVEAKKLSVDDVQKVDLKAYDTIIVDIRGYEAHPELIAANTRLLNYVNEGGTLVVFYHKTNEWNPDPPRNRPQLAPYPIMLGNERVTDENAAVTFLQRAHPLLNFPNRITQSDFAGWIQERGLYYPKDWDAHYSALLAMNDAGEPALRGGLLAADYGRGHYIYTSLVWYRELRAGVPGAYRMFANMISYGHR